jgi:hypothetical protein
MRLILPLVCLILVAGCAPSPEIVATAMAQTQAALPTETPIPPTATRTFTPVPPTNTPTETSTPTLTPTSTPDLRIIDASPEDIVCDVSDLPIEDDYYIPSLNNDPGYYRRSYTGFSFHYTNKYLAITSANKVYIAETGRIDGWGVTFKKGLNSYSGFPYILCDVESFESSGGAQLAVQKFNSVELYPQDGLGYLKDATILIGDASVIIVNEKHYLANRLGENFKYDLQIDFAYRNYRVRVGGPNRETSLDQLYYVANNILEKLKEAPLSLP